MELTIPKQKVDENNNHEKQTEGKKVSSDDAAEGNDNYDGPSIDDVMAVHCIEVRSDQESNQLCEVQAVAENQAGINTEEYIAKSEMRENTCNEEDSCTANISESNCQEKCPCEPIRDSDTNIMSVNKGSSFDFEDDNLEGLKQDATNEIIDNQAINSLTENELKNHEDKDDQFSVDCDNQKESTCKDKSEVEESRTYVSENLLNPVQGISMTQKSQVEYEVSDFEDKLTNPESKNECDHQKESIEENTKKPENKKPSTGEISFNPTEDTEIEDKEQENCSDCFEDIETGASKKQKKKEKSDSLEVNETIASKKQKKREKSDSLKDDKTVASKKQKKREESDSFEDKKNDALKKRKKRVNNGSLEDKDNEALKKQNIRINIDNLKDRDNIALKKQKKRVKRDSLEEIDTKAIKKKKIKVNKQKIIVKSESLKLVVHEKYSRMKISPSALCLMIMLVCFKTISDPIVHQLPKVDYSNLCFEVNVDIYAVGYRGLTCLPPEEPPDSPPQNSGNLAIRPAENTNDNIVNNYEMAIVVSSEEPLIHNLDDNNMSYLTDMNFQDNENNYLSLRDNHLEITIREERNHTIVPLPSVHNTSNQYEESGSQNTETSLKVNERILEGEIQSTMYLDRPESTAAPTNNVVVNETLDVPGSDVDSNLYGHLFNLTEFDSMNIPPGLSDTRTRAQTFNHPLWPHRFLDPQTMAEAGLFYTGEEDRTKCFFCKEVLLEWKQGDDPLKEHIEKFPACNYARFKQANGENRGQIPGKNEASDISPEHRTENQGYLQLALHTNPSRNGHTELPYNDANHRCRLNSHDSKSNQTESVHEDLHLQRDLISVGNELNHQTKCPLSVSNQRRDLQQQPRQNRHARKRKKRKRRAVSRTQNLSGSQRVLDKEETKRVPLGQHRARVGENQRETAQELHESGGFRELYPPLRNRESVAIEETSYTQNVTGQVLSFERRARFHREESAPACISLASRRSEVTRIVQQITLQNSIDDEKGTRSDTQAEESLTDRHRPRSIQRTRNGNMPVEEIDELLDSDIGRTFLREGFSRSEVARAIQNAGRVGRINRDSVEAALRDLNARRRRRCVGQDQQSS